eukprot:CAMPEP_0197241990 /NCGR_PEP_ID=MMETSP1429-20130617/7861_1 /TAXON_ID=49237 /ORGANISM="Chaetoceros  sp., Strain UNC1202" /LENGTH=110 /DNA_ID=CAMNT_0042701915 /DNA_START=137 /DNA_END=469 /DNA_ORIENTATION=+
MTTFLAVATPIYFLSPTDSIPSAVEKSFGALIAINVSAHSWIGLNYVVTDYVPKVNKAMVGPARIFTAGLGLLTLAGLGKIAVNDQGGIKGAVTGLWKKKEQKNDKLETK